MMEEDSNSDYKSSGEDEAVNIEDMYQSAVKEALREEKKGKGNSEDNEKKNEKKESGGSAKKKRRHYNKVGGDRANKGEDSLSKPSELKLEISKKASLLGRPTNFVSVAARVDMAIEPRPELWADYIDRSPMNRGVQVSNMFSCHEANTGRVEFCSQGMNHIEGGWPKDVNPAEADQTNRFRKKVEKDEHYIATIQSLSQVMEQCIRQNNALELYEDYFVYEDERTRCQRPKARTIHVFRDVHNKDNNDNNQSANKDKHSGRPVSSIAFCSDGGSKIAIGYCNLVFQEAPDDVDSHALLFHIEDPTEAELRLETPSPAVCVEYNPRDPHVIAAGCYNGQICWYDTRKGGQPCGQISLDLCHKDPVYGCLWTNSKSCSEFFTCSTDGHIKWWDTRNFANSLDIFEIEAACCLEFESSIPTRFMVGTERGEVFCCNRKSKTPNERIAAQYQAHFGPVYALQRNPCFPKNFITVGDFGARIWAEEIRESAIMYTTSTSNVRLTDGCWSPTRPSVFFTSRMDGGVDCWDVLHQHKEPVLRLKMSDSAVHCVRAHESGLLLAAGCNNGNVTLVELTDDLATANRADKTAVVAMFDRETRREKILEARNKELRLKEKTKGILGLGATNSSAMAISAFNKGNSKKSKKKGEGNNERDKEDNEDPIVKAEREYFAVIQKEQEARIERRKKSFAGGSAKE